MREPILKVYSKKKWTITSDGTTMYSGWKVTRTPRYEKGYWSWHVHLFSPLSLDLHWPLTCRGFVRHFQLPDSLCILTESHYGRLKGQSAQLCSWHTANSVYFRVWHSGSRTNRCVSGRHPSVDVDTPPQAQWGQDWAVLPSRAGIIHARPLRLLTTLRCQWVGWQGTWPRQSSHCGLMPYMNLNGFVHLATHLMV